MGTLSQEEINALLNDSFKGKDSRVGGKELLNSFERDALGEVSNISMGAAATTLSAFAEKSGDYHT